MKLEDLRERPGVYTIWFGDIPYVGSAINLYVRIRRHKRGFGQGNHRNKALLDAFLKHGSYRFGIKFYDVDTEKELLHYEHMVIDQLKEAGFQVLNKNDPTSSPMAGRHHTEETKQKMQEAATGRIPSEETKRKMHQSGKRNWKRPEYQKKLEKIMGSDEYRKKMSDVMTVKMRSEETKQKMIESQRVRRRREAEDGS